MDSLNFSSFRDPVLDILAQYFPCSLKKYCFVDGKTDDGKLEKKVVRCQNNLWQKILGNSQVSGKITGFV